MQAKQKSNNIVCGVDGGAGNRLVGGFLPIWLCHAKTSSTAEFYVNIGLLKLKKESNPRKMITILIVQATDLRLVALAC